VRNLNNYDAFLAAREKPIFEMLKDVPTADVKVAETAETEVSNNATRLSFQLTNGDRYARLLRLRAAWNESPLLRI
jgi:hypothetical protein